MAKQDDYARYTIRIPREIYQALEQAAYDSGRSINSEITDRIQQTLDTKIGQTQNNPLPATEENKIIKSLTENIADKEKIIKLQEDIISTERYNLRDVNYKYRDILWDVLSYAGEIPDDLLINADWRIEQLENPTHYGLTEEEEEALKEPDSEKAEAVRQNLIERARRRYDHKMHEASRSLRSVGRKAEKKEDDGQT